MLTFVWGVLALVLAVAGFIPALRGMRWVDIPFSVTGAIIGILSVFGRPRGGTKATIAGTVMCMVACLAGILLLVLAESDT